MICCCKADHQRGAKQKGEGSACSDNSLLLDSGIAHCCAVKKGIKNMVAGCKDESCQERDDDSCRCSLVDAQDHLSVLLVLSEVAGRQRLLWRHICWSMLELQSRLAVGYYNTRRSRSNSQILHCAIEKSISQEFARMPRILESKRRGCAVSWSLIRLHQSRDTS